MSGRTIEIAEHLWTVLETMARDMATEPRALVNQAVFNWARRNGYPVSAPAAEAEAAPVMPVPAPAAVPAAAVVVAAPAPRSEVVLVEEPMPEAKAQPLVVAKVAEPVAKTVSQEARIAAIDADVDRYCLVPVVVDAQFEEQNVEAEEERAAPAEAEVEASPRVPALDVAALRLATAERVVAIDRAVDEVLPRPQPAAAVPIPVPVAAAPVHARPTLTIAPATLAAASAAPAPTAAPAKSRQRLDTSELDDLLGEVDDILGHNVVRDTALSPAIPFVLELRVRGTDQVCTVATEPVVIGRGPHCDLVLQSSEASREHAVVTRTGAAYVIEDRGSSNGTWFAGEQVRSREIHSGDVFRIGSVDVVASFKVGDAQAKAG